MCVFLKCGVTYTVNHELVLQLTDRGVNIFVDRCPLSLLEELDTKVRAEHIVRISTAHLNCRGLISPEDITTVSASTSKSIVTAYVKSD